MRAYSSKYSSFNSIEIFLYTERYHLKLKYKFQGAERSGKSRLLDAFVTIVRNRQLKLVQLSLHESYAEKSYAVLYQVFIQVTLVIAKAFQTLFLFCFSKYLLFRLQLFNAVDCTSSLSRQKVLLSKLAHVLAPGDFCYLNAIMRVQFPLSNELCRSSDWQRHTKTIKIDHGNNIKRS